MFTWNKDKGFPVSLKLEFRCLIVKYLVTLITELTALMKFQHYWLLVLLWGEMQVFDERQELIKTKKNAFK